MLSARDSSQPSDQTHVSCISCVDRSVLYHQCHLGSPSYVLIQCKKHQIRKNTPDEYLSRLGRPTSFQEEVCESTIGEDWVNIAEEHFGVGNRQCV